MSEPLQSGYHPDADQLSAFIEHALPPHEQEQTLAHLAICPHCRSIVSISLPAIEESPKLQPESARKPWFFGWNLAWPAAAAVAGLALFIIHVHNPATTHSNIAAPTQMATSHPPEPPPAPIATTAPASGKISSFSSETQSRRARSSAAEGSPDLSSQKTEAEIIGQNTVINGGNINALSQQSRDLAELKQRQPVSPNMAGERGLDGSISGNTTGLMASSGATAYQNTAGNTLDRLQQSASGGVSGGSQSATAAPAATRNLRQAMTAAAPPPPAVADAAPVRAANHTVEVAAAAAPVATLSSMNNRPVDQAASLLLQHPLPSRLPALAVVSTAFQTLVIDTQNTVFFSDDGGSHWKAVPPQWQGRAVKVNLTSSASSGPPPSKLDAFGGPILSGRRVADSSALPALTGTVTDPTGAVIPNASISISDATTQNIRIVKTDQTGRYLVDNLVPGNYQVDAQAPGFNDQQVSVIVAASQQSTANLTLQIGQSAETVTVEESPKPVTSPSFAKRKAPEQQSFLPIFEITTDGGDHWTSVDGQTWKRK
jgi:hypothetical protein